MFIWNIQQCFKNKNENTRKTNMMDGKTICSTATMKEHEKSMHMITALLADESVSIGQITVEIKSNEIPAVRELIEVLDIKESVLTLDATDKECEYEIYTTIEKGDGRIEKRTCYVLNEVAFFTDYLATWKGLKKIFAVKREIEKDGKKTKEISCYLSSKNTTAKKLLSYTRKYWQIESFHWLSDMNYKEDHSRVVNKNSQVCLNIIRKYCIIIIKKL